ncbi:MAG: McrBC 5-methylcytosine restriction system component [Pelotomaculum sp. PtaB.Bin104]|nr:MAG: McrBC 5-methylcytosine restriction system component [Pelotomaculum sp. PtaB.Bin104]
MDYDGSAVDVVLQAGTRVGALPLLSPTTGRPDYGLIIKPRFEWPGIGLMLGKMGWRVLPSLLQLPLLPRSDRKIPLWVLSTTILLRLKGLLDALERRFDFTESNLPAPRGSVLWSRYMTSNMAAARFLEVPCRYPDLRDDRELKAAVHFTLRKQLAGLESQRNAGPVVLQLIGICQSLLERVRTVAPKQPSAVTMGAWYRGPVLTKVFRDGLQAIEWTVEDRGLAGLGDLQGLPWVMPMEEFFEAWMETIAAALTRHIGGVLHVGRKRETIAPLVWDPPYVGSQKYLLPDLTLERLSERGQETIIFDAKYKGHWEDLNYERWGKLDEELRERHRADLLQVLAYSTLSEAGRIISCLVYPCQKHTYESLKKRGRLYHRAALHAGRRSVNLVLTAIPMEAEIEEMVRMLAAAVS